MAYTFSEIIFLIGLGFSLAAPLGPVNMEMIKQGLSSVRGWILGIITGVGAMTGDFVIATSVLFVGAEFLQNLLEQDLIFGLLLLLNVGILGYVGISAWRSDPQKQLKELEDEEEIEEHQESDANQQAVKQNSVSRQYGIGLVLVMTSPWSYLWWASFGPVILNSGLPLVTFSDRFVVTIVFLAGIFMWLLLLAIILRYSYKVASPRLISIIVKASALLIFGFAIKILNDGLCVLFEIGLCT